MSTSDEGADGDAWAELYAALPAGWVVMSPTYDQVQQVWRVYARDLRGAPREYQPWEEGVGADRATALRVLAQRFRGADGDATA